MARARRGAAAELTHLLEEVGSPLYLIDAQRVLVFANSALEELLGCPIEALLGRVCNYHSQAATGSEEAILAALGPPPEALSGQIVSGHLMLPRRGAANAACHVARFLPLGWESDPAVGVLVIVGPTVEAGRPTISPDPTAHELHHLLATVRAANLERYRLDRLIGRSTAIRRARARAELAIASDASVLVVGPPGSGRRHLARTIHYSQAGDRPLVTLACEQLSEERLREALASLPADSGEAGKRPGTLLLSDVDELPLAVQVDLAAYGARRARLRLVATARQPLDPLVAAGRYHAELASTLGTLTIELPSLAARLADLPLLAQVYLEDCNALGRKQVGGFTPEALDRLHAYPWPGNIDELGEVIRQAHQRAESPLVTLDDLPEKIRQPQTLASGKPDTGPIDLAEVLADVERELIRRALAQTRGNKAKAARRLGLTRPRLYRRMVQLGLEPPPAPRKRPETELAVGEEPMFEPRDDSP